ncbi:Nucleoporin NUP188-like protein [Nymphaea thermarum]|nr:Nucleoporin NUP188-like protein [Nymphaea thermarum]
MATVAAAINQVAGPKTLDASLWWDSSSDLLNDLERLSSSDSNVAPSLANRLKINGRWLLETVALFKPPNPASKEALNATSVNLGSHNVVIRPELRNPAIKVSDCLGLDELQSYLLLSRFLESNSVFEVNKIEEFTHLVLVSYYQERQCLLKCLRQILMLALSIPSDPKGKSFFLEEAQHLVHDGLEEKIFTTFLLLVSSNHPEFMAVEFVNLWAEETLIELVLTLEILFLLYYEPFHRCSAKRWKNLCSLFKDILSGSQNIEKLAVSAEAAESLAHVKIQLFLILLEALELDNLLQMVHNEVPFRQGNSTFSYSELLEMDTMISGFNPSETAEAGPLFLSWGIFLCLISSLPEKDDSIPILDVDHTGYVRQAFEAAPLEFFLEILRSNMLKDLDALVIGYRSVLKTCIAAFIASYDLEDNVQTIVVDVLCEIYHGQGTLCMQFWDKDSFVDGPIRCLLLSLQEEFPQSTIKLVRLLSALCEGEWPAECVCNYLDKIASITMNFEVSGNYIREDFQVLQAQQPIAVPGIDGLVIPTGTMGQVLKVGSDKVALVRWELVKVGVEDEAVSAFVVFCLRYVLVNHENWKYSTKDEYWKVKLKVFDVLKNCLVLKDVRKLGSVIHNILVCDSSMHGFLLQMLCTTADKLEKLHMNRLYRPKEIEGLEVIICLVLDIMQLMLSDVEVAIQVAAARVLSRLCVLAEKAYPHSVGILSFISNDHEPAFLASLVFLGEDAGKVLAECETDALGMKRLESTSPKLLRSKDQRSLINSVLKYIVGANDLIKSHPEFLLKVLQFLRALWRGGTQYVKILEMLKDSKMFWKHLSAPIMIKFANQPSIKKIGHDGSPHLAYVYQCQSTILWIMSCDALWKQKLSNNGTHPKDVASSDGKNGGHGSISTSGTNNIEHIISEWHKESSITSLIKSYVPCAYDKNTIVQAKLTEQPMFLELQAQRRLDNLGSIADLKVQIMSDLCHHIHGELDMLHFSIGPLRELSQFLLQLNPWQSNNLKHSHAFQHIDPANYLFDTTGIHTDLGLDFWLTSDWKESKAMAENMLSCMEHANLMAIVSDSQVAALRSLTLLLCVYKGNLAEAKLITYDQSSSRAFMESSVEYLCKFSQTADILEYSYDSTEQSILEAQSEILLHLVSGLYDQVSSSSDRKHVLSLCLLVIKSAASNLKVLVDVKLVSVVQKKTVKYLLTLILLSAKFIKSLDLVKPTAVAGCALGETPMVSLGLLPVLCRAVETAEYCDLSLAAIDVIISGFLASNSWLPVLQKHLRLHHIMQLLQQVNSSASISTTLKFLLTLARVRGGAEMLWQADFISFLKVLLSSLETKYLPKSGISNGFLGIFKEKGHDHIWELGTAVLAAMIHSLGDDSSSMAIVEEATSFFFLEKPHLMSCLCASNFATDDQDKKRARIQKPQTSLVALRETEHTLILISELSKHPAWSKTMSLLESQLRERIIHLLAFISKGIQNFSESLNKMSFFCPPTLKEEREFCTKPSSVQSKYGWLSISAKCSSIKDKTLALPCIKPDGVQGKAGGEIESGFHTYFSYLTAIKIYRISALLLRFLCMQAIAAAKSAEDVGLIDFAHFPELPMPEILHGLQDQAVSIVTELLESERATVSPDVQTMCLLLLQIMEKALYLELCVSQTCGMRPVSARVEDFFKEIKGLIKDRNPLKDQATSWVCPDPEG